MSKGIPVKIPVRMYTYLKERAAKKETDMKIEAGKMFDRFQRLRVMEKKMQGKKVLVFK
jgi:hypothetical protein